MNQEYRDPSFNWQKDATRIVPNSTSASETPAASRRVGERRDVIPVVSRRGPVESPGAPGSRSSSDPSQPLATCAVCGAYVGNVEKHRAWHRDTGTGIRAQE